MSNWLIGFSEGTWAYQLRRLDVLGFRPGNGEFLRTAAAGDYAFAYVSGISSLSGLFHIKGSSFADDSPLYRASLSGPDIYSLRFPADAIWVAPPGTPIDLRRLIGELRLFANLSDQRAWGGVMRNLPLRLSDDDALVLRGAVVRANPALKSLIEEA